MNKFLLLLIVIGLAVAGWLNREMISGWMAEKGWSAQQTQPQPAEEATPSADPVKPPATPNPAIEAVAQAKKAYPALAKAGSAFNLKFVALYNQTKASNPDALAQANWPLQLAERTAKELGGGAVPVSNVTGVSGWTENYAEAVEHARIENKKLLLDFTGSDWCGYCKALEREVFNSPKFQAWARDNVVLVRLDYPKNHPQSSRVHEQNAALEAKYPVNGYPTIMIVDVGGNVLIKRSGYNIGSGPDPFLAWVDSAVRR